MAEGIRATVEFTEPSPCTVADVAAETDSTIDAVWRSVATDGAVDTVTEFLVEAEERPDANGTAHVLSVADRHLLRHVHDGGVDCPCECLGRFGCATQRYVAREGTLRLVFNAADFEELQAVVGELRDRFPDVDVRRLVRSPDTEATRDAVFADRGRLTERQLEVLRTAYRMGYFERPRGANATEVAAELDVGPSTITEHLAAAQRKLLGDVLGDGRG